MRVRERCMRRFRRFETSLGSHFQKTSSFTLSSIDRVDDCLSGIVACDAIYGEINILISGQMPPSRAIWCLRSLKQHMHSLNGTASSLAGRSLQTPCTTRSHPKILGLPKPFPRLPKRHAARRHRCMSIKSLEPFPWNYVVRWS